MHTLSKFQLATLTKLANRGTKMFCVAVPRNSVGQINLDFNEMLQLVQWGLVDEVTDAFPNLIREYTSSGGDSDVLIVRLIPRGQAMFERTKWGKRIN